MFSKDMASTGLAPFAVTERRFAVRADVFCSLRDVYRIWFPQREGVDRRSRPGSAGLTMAIAHGGRLTADREANRAAKAASLVHVPVAHGVSPWWCAGVRTYSDIATVLPKNSSENRY